MKTDRKAVKEKLGKEKKKKRIMERYIWRGEKKEMR
jgi:hypothetical protein